MGGVRRRHKEMKMGCPIGSENGRLDLNQCVLHAILWWEFGCMELQLSLYVCVGQACLYTTEQLPPNMADKSLAHKAPRFLHHLGTCAHHSPVTHTHTHIHTHTHTYIYTHTYTHTHTHHYYDAKGPKRGDGGRASAGAGGERKTLALPPLQETAPRLPPSKQTLCLGAGKRFLP